MATVNNVPMPAANIYPTMYDTMATIMDTIKDEDVPFEDGDFKQFRYVFQTLNTARRMQSDTNVALCEAHHKLQVVLFGIAVYATLLLLVLTIVLYRTKKS